MTEQAAEVEGRRSHPATPLVRAWLWLLAALAWVVQAVARGEQSFTVAGWVVAGAVVAGLAVGYVTWVFTYFVIDGTELRIDSGVFVKRSRRMPYTRIQSIDIAQPFGARIYGLAELRIEMAGGEESRTQLQFLSLREARRLRRTLLARLGATGADVPQDPTDGAEDATGAAEPASPRRLITAVPAGRLVLGLLVSTDFALALAAAFALLAALLLSLITTVLSGADGFTASIVPVALAIGGWVVTLARARVFEQWGFQLSYAANGLRIDRGLFNRISQSVPVDRVQGVVIEQPLLWQPFGWYRIRVDTAGYSRGEAVKDEDSTSTLLPVGRLGTVREVTASVLPDVDPTHVHTRTAPRRSAWFAPIGWRYRAAGYDERVVVVSRGWLLRRTDVVPHAKTQSVRLVQGPLQRRLELADVVIDTTKGPVNAYAQSRDSAEARTLALTQLDRARAARRASS